MLCFTYGERKICSTIKKSQNILNMTVDQFKYAEFNVDVHVFHFQQEITFLCSYGPKKCKLSF